MYNLQLIEQSNKYPSPHGKWVNCKIVNDIVLPIGITYPLPCHGLSTESFFFIAELKASFRSFIQRSLRDPVGIRTQDPQLRRLLLYPAELPDHPLMDFPSFSQASSTRSFYVWLSHTKHHARTYAHAICGCKGTLFLRTSQILFQLFFSVRQFLCQKEWKPHVYHKERLFLLILSIHLHGILMPLANLICQPLRGNDFEPCSA